MDAHRIVDFDAGADDRSGRIAFPAPGSVSAVLVGQQATPQTQFAHPLAQRALTTTARNVPTER